MNRKRISESHDLLEEVAQKLQLVEDAITVLLTLSKELRKSLVKYAGRTYLSGASHQVLQKTKKAKN